MMAKEIVTLCDDTDNKIDFLILHVVTVEDIEYLLLEEIDKPEKHAFILKREQDILTGIQDEDEFNMVSGMFREKFEETELE